MKFEWDDKKNQLNKETHGVFFEVNNAFERGFPASILADIFDMTPEDLLEIKNKNTGIA